MKKIVALFLIVSIPAIALKVIADDTDTAKKIDLVAEVPEKAVCDPMMPPDLQYQRALEKAHETYRGERKVAWDKFRDAAFAARSKRDKVVESECNKYCDGVKEAWRNLKDGVENAKVKDARNVAKEKWQALKRAACDGRHKAANTIDAALSAYEKEMKEVKRMLREALKTAQEKLDKSETAAFESWDRAKNQKTEPTETLQPNTEVKTDKVEDKNK